MLGDSCSRHTGVGDDFGVSGFHLSERFCLGARTVLVRRIPSGSVCCADPPGYQFAAVFLDELPPIAGHDDVGAAAISHVRRWVAKKPIKGVWLGRSSSRA